MAKKGLLNKLGITKQSVEKQNESAPEVVEVKAPEIVERKPQAKVRSLKVKKNTSFGDILKGVQEHRKQKVARLKANG